MTQRVNITINTDGTPVCPTCNEPMHWESDWSADEVLVPENEGLAPNESLGLWSCPKCGKMYYIYNDGEAVLGIDSDLL